VQFARGGGARRRARVRGQRRGAQQQATAAATTAATAAVEARAKRGRRRRSRRGSGCGCAAGRRGSRGGAGAGRAAGPRGQDMHLHVRRRAQRRVPRTAIPAAGAASRDAQAAGTAWHRGTRVVALPAKRSSAQRHGAAAAANWLVRVRVGPGRSALQAIHVTTQHGQGTHNAQHEGAALRTASAQVCGVCGPCPWAGVPELSCLRVAS
jgi:hypothetical protein